ncbi:MAG TPA: isoprenylcysteine carboxylmethyltransferase family protein [Ktedonobacteraceae bacterium]|nr:isoprenylcysteine carboxylmethyltransferase family protein [Ktedonobacteraceae bacterium]
MEDELRDNPGIIAPPPLIYAGSLALGLILNARFPARLVSFLPRVVRAILGGSLVGFALTVITLAFRTMMRAGTNVDPSRPATVLVVDGPFKYTRNPLYLSLTLLYAGIAILVNSLWTMLLLPVVLVVMRKGVVDREERYLARKFGEQYLRYKASVRRWI